MVQINFTDDMMDVAYMTAQEIEAYLAHHLMSELSRLYRPQVLRRTDWVTAKELYIELRHNLNDKDYEVLEAYLDEHSILNELELFEHFLAKQFGEHWTFKFFVENNRGCYIVRIEE